MYTQLTDKLIGDVTLCPAAIQPNTNSGLCFMFSVGASRTSIPLRPHILSTYSPSLSGLHSPCQFPSLCASSSPSLCLPRKSLPFTGPTTTPRRIHLYRPHPTMPTSVADRTCNKDEVDPSNALRLFLERTKTAYLAALHDGKGNEWVVVMGNEAGGACVRSYLCHFLLTINCPCATWYCYS